MNLIKWYYIEKGGKCMIEFKDVSKKFGKKTIIKNLNFTVNTGELVTLIGLSGCGKTTTLKTINRLHDLNSGKILIDGQDIMAMNPIVLRRQIGYVIQQTGLFPHLTIAENIGIIPEAEKESATEIEQRVKKYMAMVGLDYETYANKYPLELSGGQQQRVGIARAFANDADIILMDEPFSALDPLTKTQLQDELVEIQAANNKTIVFVTHDMNEAIRISDRICLMKDGEVVQFDTPENILRNPESDFVSNFVGNNKLWSSPEYLKAIDIINTKPVTININNKLIKAIERLKNTKVEYLMVIDNDRKFLGYVAAKDLRMDKSGDSLQDYLRNDMFTCNSESSLLELFDIIKENEVTIMPVLDDEQKLVGIITKTSIMLSFINQTLAAGGE